MIETVSLCMVWKIHKMMLYLGYRRSLGDHTLLFKHSQEGKFIVMLVYVDDIIIFGDDSMEKQLLKE